MADKELGLIGECYIEKALLLKFDDRYEVGRDEGQLDIKFMITRFNISESIDNAVMDVSIDVFDTLGIVEKMPIIGEEKIVLVVRDDFSNVTLNMDLFVTGITNMYPHPNGNGISYTLNCLSQTSFKGICRKVVAPFAKPASEIAKDVFDQTYDKLKGDLSSSSVKDKFLNKIKDSNIEYEILELENDLTKTFTVEKSDVELRCVIPNLYANEALSFLAQRAVNTTKNLSSSYHFFETKYGYFFATNELMIKQALNELDGKKVKKMTYNTSYDIKGENSSKQAEKLKAIEIIKYNNSIDTIRSGAYNAKLTELDVIYGRMLPSEFGYEESQKYFGGMTGNSQNKGEVHSKEFLESVLVPENMVEMYRIKNYDSFNNVQLPGDQMFAEKILRTNAYEQRLNATVLKCAIDGRLDLAVGDIVDLKLEEMTADETKVMSEKFSGKYFVREVSNIMEHGKLETIFYMVKYGWEK